MKKNIESKEKKNNERVVALGLNKFDQIAALFYCFLKNYDADVYSYGTFSSGIPNGVLSTMKKVPFWQKYWESSVHERFGRIGDSKGFLFEAYKDVIDLTIIYYKEHFSEKKLFGKYCDRIFKTNKMEAFIKDEIAKQMISFLVNLKLISFDNIQLKKKLVIIISPINKVAIDYFEKKYGGTFDIEEVRSYSPVLACFQYAIWLIKECFLRGLTKGQKRRTYKLAKAVVFGCEQKTLSDDLLIDNDKFLKDDILFLNFEKENSAFNDMGEKLKEKGYSVENVSDFKIRIDSLPKHLLNYVFRPLKSLFFLLIEGKYYFVSNICQFYKHCFLLSMIFEKVSFKVFLSHKDWGNVEETIALNIHGSQCVIFHWSALRFYKISSHAFVAHNVYYFWGPAHSEFQYSNALIDKRVNVGCIYKKEFSDSLKSVEEIISEINGFDSRRQSVLFCDTSFSSNCEQTEMNFLEFIRIMTRFCESHDGVNVLFKPKKLDGAIELALGDKAEEYRQLVKCLSKRENYFHFDGEKVSFVKLLSISDLCVSMGMNSTSVVSLICRKDALFYDKTGNKEHPWAKEYFNILVFDDEEKILRQIDRILKGEFSSIDVLSEQEIREIDAFDDDLAIDRIREDISILCALS